MALFDEIPGYREAIQSEVLIRDASFLPVTETLCGFEVRPMLFEDYLALRLVRSPFLVGGEPTPADIRSFMWRLSPDYHPTAHKARRKLMRRLMDVLPPPEPILPFRWCARRWARRAVSAFGKQGELLIAIRAYVEDAFQDWPSSKSEGETVPYYSDGVAIVATLAREYGWSEDAIMRLKMKKLLQYLKEIRHHAGAKVLFNKSDLVKSRWLESQNKN